MGTILVFSEIEKKALETARNTVLFGERDWLNDGNRVYDIFFHVKTDVQDAYGTPWPVSMVVPVLRDLSDDEAPPQIAGLSKMHPAYQRFAVAGKFLDFYDVIHGEGWTKVPRLGKYKTLPRNKFFAHIQDPELEEEIKQKVRAINAVG